MKSVPFRAWVVERADDDRPAIRFEDETWTYREAIQASAERAAFMLARRRKGPLHVGVLLENVPEFYFWLAAAAICGGVVVGINPTRRGAELARDIQHTDCQWIVTDAKHRELLGGLDLAPPILQIDSDETRDLLSPFAGTPLPDVQVSRKDCLLLLFTSGTSGAPKAVICSRGKLSLAGQNVARLAHLDDRTVTYLAMPMFHSNCLFTGWAPTLMKQMDAMYLSWKAGAIGEIDTARDPALKELPSFYARRNCWYGASFPGPRDVAGRDLVGKDRILWGKDYPHYEGSYPYSRENMRLAFSELPEGEVRMMLGENAARLYAFDLEALRPAANEAGITPELVATRLDKIPEDSTCLAFLRARAELATPARR